MFVRPDREVRLEPSGSLTKTTHDERRRNVIFGTIAVVILLLSAAFLLAFMSRPGIDPAWAATMTAVRQQLDRSHEATLTAVANDPASMRTAVALTQEAQSVQLETSVAATIQAFRTEQAPGQQTAAPPSVAVPFAAQIATDTPEPPTALPSATPDVTLTAEADRMATVEAVKTAAVRETAASILQLTATATHLVQNGSMQMAGATSLQGLTDRMIQRFKSATGYRPDLQPEYTGTSGGFERFCAANSAVDIVLATGTDPEQSFLATCRAAGREPVGFQVAIRPADPARDRPNREPLTLYTTASILRTKPQVALFIRYYLENATQVIASFAPNEYEYESVREDIRTDALRRLEAIVGP